MFTKIFQEITVTAHLAREVMTKAEHKIYNYLSNSQKGGCQTDQLGQQQMATALGLSRGHVNRSIGRLVERGLLLIRRQYQPGSEVLIDRNIYVVVRNAYHHLAEWRQLQKLRAGWLAKRRKKAARLKKVPCNNNATAFHDFKYNSGCEQAEIGVLPGWTPDEMQFMRSRHAC